MGKYLDEMINKAENNRISDLDKVWENAERLAYSKLGELSPDFAYYGEWHLKWFALPYADSNSLRFGELLCLKRVQCCSCECDDFAAGLLPLLSRDGFLPEVRAFLNSTIDAFTRAIDKYRGLTRGRSVYGRICHVAEQELNIDITPDMTVKELFDKFGSITVWNPHSLLDSFYKRTKACCLIAKLLLIDCFRFAFGELFIMSDLKIRLEYPDDTFYPFDEIENEYTEYDNVNIFGDAYDTEADDFLIGGEKMRRKEEKKMAEEWDEARFRLLKPAGKRK